ncbi:hypothetical protein SHKM778_73310 [Streptomyces sp. KM77-8]|uniref:Uncharacterized protein n=1 Tax=Streptomyces haneummycinicus TaxID=3074435 RepID=A0AAT9HU13_9ACTN
MGDVTMSSTVRGSREAKKASWAVRRAPRSRQAERSGQGTRRCSRRSRRRPLALEGPDHRADGGGTAVLGDAQAAAPAAAGGEQAHVLEFGDDLRGVRVRHVHRLRDLTRRGSGIARHGEAHEDAKGQVGGAEEPHIRQRR